MDAYNFTQSAHVGNWYVKVDPMAHYGYFEHENGGEGGLWFEDDRLTDYDGFFELPVDVCLALRKLGYYLAPEFWPDLSH